MTFIRSEQSQTATEFIKRHVNPPQFDTETRLLRIAHGVGCAPAFVVEPPLTIRLPLLRTFTDWLDSANAEQKLLIARRVLAQLRLLHQAGVCHRDLKAGDIVMEGDKPLFIDFELGTAVDPGSPCYDLLGPSCGVPLPPIHAAIGLTEGVWWDSTYPTTLWHYLGHVADI
jgi:predicted Ser/Thr protein kinase